jgi:Starch-binding associating with outer membrane/Susd and RagB outer membrane lipoprotein
MKLKYISKIVLTTGLISLLSACDLTDLDINKSPNSPTVASAKLLLPTAEFAAINAVTGISTGTAMGFAGLVSNSDNFDLNNQSYNGTWNGFYRNMTNVEAIINASANSPHYLGVAQALKAFAMGDFVDTFGDCPYSEAWKGNAETAITQPKFDKDSEIYESLIKLCDESVANLSKVTADPLAASADFMYGGSAAKWIKFAKSVKIRLLLNSRKGRATGDAELKAAIAAGGYITAAADDFTFNYSTASSPEGRHPWFQSAYLADNGFSYPSHQLMEEMIFNKDPRLDFYFYRQTETILDPSNPTDRGTIPYGGTYLVLKPAFLAKWKTVFGADPSAADLKYIAGFFGRDRGDNTGVPQDGALRTAPGCYPAGGLFGGRNVTPKALTGGRGSGNGIFPLLTSNNMKYYQIESILDGGGTGDAKAIFEAAIREHVARVIALGKKVDAANVVEPNTAYITDYVNAQLKLYDAASSNSAKLNVVLKQLWYTSWGQGSEIWNAMRRTGFPSQINNPIIKPPRQYALRLPYPSQEGSLNPNATSKLTEVIFDRDPVFWDKVKLKWEF